MKKYLKKIKIHKDKENEKGQGTRKNMVPTFWKLGSRDIQCNGFSSRVENRT